MAESWDSIVFVYISAPEVAVCLCVVLSCSAVVSDDTAAVHQR